MRSILGGIAGVAFIGCLYLIMCGILNLLVSL